jgi:hypothetical protein
MRRIGRRKDVITTMTNADASTTENAVAVAEQGATVAPEAASSKNGTSQKKGTPKGQKAAKGSKPKPAEKKEAKAGKQATKPAAKKASTPCAEGKGAMVLELSGRPKGASLAAILLLALQGKTLGETPETSRVHWSTSLSN